MGNVKLAILFMGISLYVLACAFLWPYSINTWLMYFGKVPSILWWQGVLLGFIPGARQLVFIVAAITWILMLFLT